MKKITKKQGMIELRESISKLVLTGYVSLEKAEDLLNMDNEKYVELTKDISKRKGIRYNNNEVVFEMLEGDVKGKKTYLNSLTGTKWYKHKSNNGEFIVIDFSEQYKDKDFNMTMAYSLED